MLSRIMWKGDPSGNHREVTEDEFALLLAVASYELMCSLAEKYGAPPAISSRICFEAAMKLPEVARLRRGSLVEWEGGGIGNDDPDEGMVRYSPGWTW